MAGMAVAGAQFKLSTADRQLLWQQYMPWATQTGLRCADLMCIYYEKHFEEDLMVSRWLFSSTTAAVSVAVHTSLDVHTFHPHTNIQKL
jgi:ubiquinone biosynthesis protein COQ4